MYQKNVVIQNATILGNPGLQRGRDGKGETRSETRPVLKKENRFICISRFFIFFL